MVVFSVIELCLFKRGIVRKQKKLVQLFWKKNRMPKILIGLFHLCSFLWQNAVAQLAVVILKLFLVLLVEW